jgi:polysaccharide export outer membrane protein
MNIQIINAVPYPMMRCFIRFGKAGAAIILALLASTVSLAQVVRTDSFSGVGSRTNLSVRPASHRQPDYETVVHGGQQGMVMQAGNCGCSGSGCATCGGTGRIPPAVYMEPPQQPTGVTSGACQPCITGVDCAQGPAGEKRWCDAHGVDFEPLWHGEYIGPVRLASLLEYRIRVNDELQITYIPSRDVVNEEYKLTPGDEVNINSVSDDTIRREKVQIQPDGSIVVPLIADTKIRAAGKTIGQLRKDLEVAYKKYINNPAINVEPFKVNTIVEDLKDAVNGPFAAGGRTLIANVNPDGRIQVIGLGSIYVLGMTTDELKRELNLRFRDKQIGIEVEPRVTRTAAHFVSIFGEVAQNGRFELQGPTTVTQGLALAGGLSLGANNRQVVIFRRAEDWRVVSTILDLRAGHLGKSPNPSDEIWLRDSDLIIVPPRPIKLFNNAVQQVFTDGIYRILPFQGVNITRQ